MLTGVEEQPVAYSPVSESGFNLLDISEMKKKVYSLGDTKFQAI